LSDSHFLTHPSLSYNFRVAPNTISLIINEVCDAIKAEFAAEVIQCPTTTEEWTINDEGDGVWSNSEVVGQAWIIVTAGQVP
jgi:hypothetical protein